MTIMDGNRNALETTSAPVCALERRAAGSLPRYAVPLVYVIYFFSGLCSLIDETVWVRLLKLVLGNTVYASSVVVSVFLGGLALGALIMARWADRLRRPLRTYAILELLATVSALSVPFLLPFADAFYRWIYRQSDGSRIVLAATQIMVSAAVLAVPSILMGSTLPVLGRYVTTLKRQVGGRVGRLYAVNTLGAASGCFLAGFVLLRALGVLPTLCVAAALNLLVALGAWMLSRTAASSASVPAPGAPPDPVSTLPERDYGRACTIVLLLGILLSGLTSIAYELTWMRSIVFLLQGHTYTFAAVLTIYLLGNVTGAAIGSRLALRIRNSTAGFGITLFVLGAAGVIQVPVLCFWSTHGFPVLSGFVWTLSGARPAADWIARPLLNCFVLFFVPSLAMGIGFPLALEAWSRRDSGAGHSTGLVYGINTTGALLGGLLAGFLYIPRFGVQLTGILLGLGTAWVGCVLQYMALERTDVRRRLIPAAAGAALLTVVVFLVPGDLFPRLVASRAALADKRLLYVNEGVTGTASVHELRDGHRLLASSGVLVAGDNELGAHKMSSHIGFLLNPQARTVLDIGFGMGETSASMVRHRPDRVDSVEISPAIVDASLKFFPHVNLGPRLHEHVNLIIMDGKNYLRVTPRRYDIIQSNPIHPKAFENASLYTAEYFESARRRLRPGGLFVCWTPLHQTRACLDSILGTFADVFEDVTIWFQTTHPEPSLLLVGSDTRQRFAPAHIDREIQIPAVRASLAYLAIGNSLDLASCYVGDKSDLRRYLKNYVRNSDYHPFVEFHIGHHLDLATFLPEFIARVRAPITSRLNWTGVTPGESAAWLATYEPLYEAMGLLLRAYVTVDPAARRDLITAALRLVPGHPLLREAKRHLPRGGP